MPFIRQPFGHSEKCQKHRVGVLWQHDLVLSARALDATLLSKLKVETIGEDRAKRVAIVRKLVADPRRRGQMRY